MINFYQAWKDDKDSNPNKKKKPGGYECIICGKSVNGLKDHMNSTHGPDTYKKFLKAEHQIQEDRRVQILRYMGLE